MPVSQLKARVARLVGRPVERITTGLDNQSQLLDIKFEKVIAGIKNQSALLDSKLERLIGGIENLHLNLNLERDVQTTAESGPPQLRSLHSDGGRELVADQANGAIPPAAATVNCYAGVAMNDLAAYRDVFAGVSSWSGRVPKGYMVDFLGTLTSADFRIMFGIDPNSVGGNHETKLAPTISDGEGWFEAVNWVVAAREARERYVMVTLGACYGAQAVGSYHALQLLNPMPYKLVAIEPDPDNMAWTMKHFRDNGIDPDRQWLIQAAISDTNAPVFFPVGSPGTGAQNCFATNERVAREAYIDQLIVSGAERALRDLLLHNTTGITKSLVEGHDFRAEIKLLSAVTLKDILGPFDFVDYLEADIQQSEILVFPPYMDLLKSKVRRIHIGTHGAEVHRSLHDLFQKERWQIVFSFEPNAQHNSALGTFQTNDGVLTVRNPRF